MNLVLAHGFFGFATIHGIAYFNGVREHLGQKFPGLRVLVTEVPPAGTIEVRGRELGEQILRALRPGGAFDPGERVHIIAHSMGGLDSRFLLSPDNPENIAGRVASLTTVSTPHRGSPIADLLVKLRDPLNILDRVVFKELRDDLARAGIEVGGLLNLTTDEARRFNEQFRDDDRTVKFSVAGTGRVVKLPSTPFKTCRLLRLPHRLIREFADEENDGLVGLSSATWGDLLERWPADHADEIGHDLDEGVGRRPEHFDYLARYAALVERLRHL